MAHVSWFSDFSFMINRGIDGGRPPSKDMEEILPDISRSHVSIESKIPTEVFISPGIKVLDRDALVRMGIMSASAVSAYLHCETEGNKYVESVRVVVTDLANMSDELILAIRQGWATVELKRTVTPFSTATSRIMQAFQAGVETGKLTYHPMTLRQEIMCGTKQQFLYD